MSWNQVPGGHLDDFVCSTHKDQVVSIYCQTCDDLICSKCITHGPSSSIQHKQHVYLDLSDAYIVKQKQLRQMITNFKDATQTKKNERVELNASGQVLKLELLRKKTAISKQTRSLHDAITRQEKKYINHFENVLKPAIIRNELRFSEVDFEVVSREGALGSAESVCNIPEEKAVQFLRAMKKVESDLVKLSMSSREVAVDDMLELKRVQHENLSLHQYKNHITRMFSIPTQVPCVPHVLPSWSTVGVTSASISFKCVNSQTVHSYVIVCQPYHVWTKFSMESDIKDAESPEQQGSQQADLTIIRRIKANLSKDSLLLWNKPRGDCQMFRVKSRPGRVTVVIRNLQPETQYKILIHAINSCGSSQPAQVFMTTLSYPKTKGQGHISVSDPGVQRSWWFMTKLIKTIVLYLFLLFFLFWALYSMYLSWNTVYEEATVVIRQMDEVLSLICPCLTHFLEVLKSNGLSGLVPFQVSEMNSDGDSPKEQFVNDEPVINGIRVSNIDNSQSAWILQSLWDWIGKYVENKTNLFW